MLYEVITVYASRDSQERASAVLAIGDDALRLNVEKRYPVQLDLGETWHKATGLPFVFSVCAVREAFLAQQADAARQVRQALVDCREQGARRMGEICDRVARRIPIRITSYNVCYTKLLRPARGRLRQRLPR